MLQLRQWCWKELKLSWKLRTGLTINIENMADWVIYNDIFVDGECDLPIKQILASPPYDRPMTFLDLGASVGFFASRVADLILRSENPKANFQLFLAEGSPTVYDRLKSRLNEPLISNRVKAFHGRVEDVMDMQKYLRLIFM